MKTYSGLILNLIYTSSRFEHRITRKSRKSRRNYGLRRVLTSNRKLPDLTNKRNFVPKFYVKKNPHLLLYRLYVNIYVEFELNLI